MSAPFDVRDLGLRIGESAIVIDSNEPLHSSRDFGWHHNAWDVTRIGPNNYHVRELHITREGD